MDAAWRGFALLVDELRTHTEGIHRAESVTWDAHKVLPVPMGAGMLFTRGNAPLEEVFGDGPASASGARARRLQDRNDSPLPLVCFTHPMMESGERTADEVVVTLLSRGNVWISSLRLAPHAPKVLRACITNHRTSPGDVRALVCEVEGALDVRS